MKNIKYLPQILQINADYRDLRNQRDLREINETTNEN